MLGEAELAILGLQGIDVDRSVRALRSDIFVEGVPSDTLNVGAVLCYLTDHGPFLSIINPSDIVHAAGDEKVAIGRPSQVVDLRTHRSAHVFLTPRFLIFGVVLAESRFGRVRVGLDPKDDVSVVTGGCQHFTARTPTDDIDGLGMLGQGRKVVDFLIFAAG